MSAAINRMPDLELPANLLPNLLQHLNQSDTVAFENVSVDEHGNSIIGADGNPMKDHFSRGGPFGAMLGISYDDGSFEQIGAARGNNVVGSGIASRHAEDQALQPDNLRLLVLRLMELKIQDINPTVWMISSAQSCTNCHTKQEIAARSLQAQGLIEPGRFVTLYGATYDETSRIAQFYDAEYADAMIFFSKFPNDPNNLIRHSHIDFADLSPAMQQVFASARVPTAVVARGGEIYTVGREARTEYDPYATAEVNAIRAACVRYKNKGTGLWAGEQDHFEAWKVDGRLYTTSAEIGPLLFAEAGWTKVNDIVTVRLPQSLASRQFGTRETSGLSSGEFLKIVAEGYENPQAAIRVLRMTEGFTNTAQPRWQKILEVNKTQLYNGAAVTEDVLKMRNDFTRQRFAAEEAGNCCPGHPLQKRRLLDAIPG